MKKLCDEVMKWCNEVIKWRSYVMKWSDEVMKWCVMRLWSKEMKWLSDKLEFMKWFDKVMKLWGDVMKKIN